MEVFYPRWYSATASWKSLSKYCKEMAETKTKNDKNYYGSLTYTKKSRIECEMDPVDYGISLWVERKELDTSLSLNSLFN